MFYKLNSSNFQYFSYKIINVKCLFVLNKSNVFLETLLKKMYFGCVWFCNEIQQLKTSN